MRMIAVQRMKRKNKKKWNKTNKKSLKHIY